MYIEPNSIIKVYNNIPLDPSYNHSVYFNTISEQNAYFHSGIEKFTFTRQSYQRIERGRMRVNANAESLYDCNYLAFRNTNFGSKWFYSTSSKRASCN